MSQEFILAEEEVSDVSLATFYVFDKDNAGPFRPSVLLARGGCGGGCGGRGCGGCGGFRGCAGGGCGCVALEDAEDVEAALALEAAAVASAA